MTYLVTYWALPQPTGGFHSFDALSGSPIEVPGDLALSQPLGQTGIPCGTTNRECGLLCIRYQTLRTGTGTTYPSAAHVLRSDTFIPGIVQPFLAHFATRLCSLVISLPHEDLEHLSDILPASIGLHYLSVASTTAVIPLPPRLVRRLTLLKTLSLGNVLPPRNLPNSLTALTTLSIVGHSQSPGYEYRISDFFEFLLCTPQLRHLRLAGIGPTIYDVTTEWVVPLVFLKTLYLHHCCLQTKIVHHLSISLDLREISIQMYARSTALNAGAVSCLTPRGWLFNPLCVDFYQEGRDRCCLRFVGTHLRTSGQDDLVDTPPFTLELSVTNAIQRFDTNFSSRCIQSFRPLSMASIRALTIHSYQPRGRLGNHVYNLLRSLPALAKLVLNGCSENPFYQALSRVRIDGKHGRRGRFVICPHLTEMEIDPIVEFRKCLGDQTPPCSKLAEYLFILVRTRKGCGAPLARLKITFPTRYRKEARFVEDNLKLLINLDTCAVCVRVA